MNEESWDKILYDRIIEVRLIAEKEDYTEDENAGGFETNQYDIIIPANEHGGMKPDLTFSASLLPEEMFHEVTLTIKNYKMPFDIRRYKKMEILAGYRKQGKSELEYDETIIRRFPIDIFYSYCMTPAPDSITVFKGIIVNSFTSTVTDYFSTNCTYTMTFYKNVSVIEFINTCVNMINKAGYNISLVEEIQPSIKEVIMNTGPSDSMAEASGVWTFTSVPDILRCISSMLEAACRDSGINGSYNVTFSDGKLIIYCTDGFYSEDEPVIYLDSISSATLNAGIINVTAPWYPPLIPGGIIYVERTYIDGSDLPNVINVDELMGKDNLYRVLTMDVDFASVGNTNSMKITAIPLRYVQDANWGSKQGKEEYAHKFEVVKKASEKLLEQVKETSAKEQREDVVEIPSVSMVIGDIPEDTNPVFAYVRDNPDLFEGLTIKSFGPADYDVMTADVCSTRLYSGVLIPLVSSVPNYQTILPEFNNRWLWPVVYAATYKAYLDTKNNETRNGKTITDEKNPFTLSPNTSTVILSGKSVSYPVLTNWDALKNAKMSGLYDAASKLPGLGSVSILMKNISDILIA